MEEVIEITEQATSYGEQIVEVEIGSQDALDQPTEQFNEQVHSQEQS